jgi:hypothetical protein
MNDDIVGSQPGIKIIDATNGGALYVYKAASDNMSYEHYRILGSSSYNAPMIDMSSSNGASPVIRASFSGSATGYLYQGRDKDTNIVFTVDHGGYVNCTGAYYVDATQVVGNRVIDARADDAVTSTWSATEAGVLDALRDAMITHGLIAAS